MSPPKPWALRPRGDPARMLRFEAVPDANAVTVCAIWEKGACSATDDSSGKGGEGGTVSLYKSDVTADLDRKSTRLNSSH